MFEGSKYHGNTAKGFSERSAWIAFWTGVSGLVICSFVYLVYALSGDQTFLIDFEVTVYAIVLTSIIFSARRDVHVELILYSGLGIIFAVYWLTNFAEVAYGHASGMDLPLALFIPLFLGVMFNYKLLFWLAPLQGLCVYFYVSLIPIQTIGFGFDADQREVFSCIVAVLSACSFAVLGIVAYAREHTDRKLFEVLAAKEELADTDGLTGLKNRRAFMNQLRGLWPNQSKICIAFVDLDHFKPLNDQYGHAVGDQVLCKVAERIKTTPEVQLTARLGGDEFAILFDSSVCETKIQDHIEALFLRITRDMRWESGLLTIGASIGYAEGETASQSLSGLLRAADTAMRRAKASSLGWAKFNPLIDNAAIASSTLEVELKSAIKNGQIRAAIQPIAEASSLNIVAYELLTRWINSGFERDPSPSDFIPIAEKLGLLNEILWVTLDEALQALDLREQKLAINVSPAQLLASDFIDSLLRILERHEVHPHAITIEITEEVAFRNVERNVAILKQARELGFEIALDDFGTGYSSLSMLDTLPLDKLKIDQSFVRKSDKSSQSKSILLAAIRLAKQLGLESCVEGIETEQAARRIAVLGADTIQGYWLGRPKLVSENPYPMKMVS